MEIYRKILPLSDNINLANFSPPGEKNQNEKYTQGHAPIPFTPFWTFSEEKIDFLYENWVFFLTIAWLRWIL